MMVAAGGYHTLAVTEDNEIFTFGAGTLGECGYGEFNNISLPNQVLLIKG